MQPRDLTDDEKQNVLETLTGGLSSVLTDTGLLFTDRAAFVNGEGSSSPITVAVRELTRFQCRQWARGQLSAQSPGNTALLTDVCTPYLDGLGETPVPAIGGSLVESGQCPGVLYQVQVVGTNNVNGNSFSFSIGNHRGPIRVGATSINLPGDCGSVNILTNNVITNGAGIEIQRQVGCGPLAGTLRAVCTPLESEAAAGCSGGNSPPSYLPPTPRPGLPALPPRVNIDFPGLGPVAVEVGINPSGQITVNLPDFGVSGETGGGNDGGGGNGGGGTAPPPGDAGEPGDSEGTGEGGDAEGEAPEGSVLVGLKISLAETPKGAVQYTRDVYRGVCYIYMGTDEGLDHDPAGAMLRDGQFVYAEKENLTKWRVSANRGYNLSVTPYYREVETEEE